MTSHSDPARDAARSAEAAEPLGVALPVPAADVRAERRSGVDRRRRFWWSLLHGGLWPRRVAGRRAEDHHRPLIDWHGPGLLASCVLILLLCCADAFLTLLLISRGAVEANPIMALWVYDDVRTFTIVKLALTGAGVLALVAIARFRVFGFVRVASLVHAVLVGYTALIVYQLYLFVLIERTG
jgi:hypothetical protein